MKPKSSSSSPSHSPISSSPSPSDLPVSGRENLPVYPVPKTTQIQEAMREYEYFKRKFDACRWSINQLMKDEAACKVMVEKCQGRLEKMGVRSL